MLLQMMLSHPGKSFILYLIYSVRETGREGNRYVQINTAFTKKTLKNNSHENIQVPLC